MPADENPTLYDTELLVDKGHKIAGFTTALVVDRLIRRARGEELQSGESLDSKTLAELGVAVHIGFSDNQGVSARNTNNKLPYSFSNASANLMYSGARA